MILIEKVLKRNSRSDLFKIAALLAIVTWIANFWYFRDLGIYEDDYPYVGLQMKLSLAQLCDLIKNNFMTFFQGRPIGFSLQSVAVLLGSYLGGLNLLYFISYCIILTNNTLFYLFLRKLWIQPIFCICGALAYTLFPADNSRTWLTSLQVLPAFTFLLIAFLCYFSNKNILSYLAITACLLCYETAFLLFIIAPLFKNNWTKQLYKKLIKHFFICAFIFIVIFIVRKLDGDSRVTNLDLISTLKVSFNEVLIGPFISLYMFAYRIFSIKITSEILFLMIVSFVCLFWVFSTFKNDPNKIIDNAFILKKLALLSLFLLLLAYPLTLTVDATQISGANSRVHNAAAFGGSILFGLFCFLLSTFLKNYRLNQLALIIIAGYFSLLVGFGLTIQNDNRVSWQYQQAFWSDIIKLAPDLSEESVVFVDSPSLNQVWGSQLHPFTDYGLGLKVIYIFPEKFKTSPLIFRLDNNWKKKITPDRVLKLANEDGLIYHGSWWYIGSPRLVDFKDVILIQEKNGKLIRQSEPISINGVKYQFKPLTASTVQSFQKKYLYDNLIPNITPKVNYLKPF
jgi:hypothetical protein